jgi:hypothetical protein
VQTVKKSKGGLTPIADYLQEGLLALIPYYKSGYKSAVITPKGRYPDKRAVSWLLETIAVHYQKDLTLIRKRSCKILDLRSNTSIVFLDTSFDDSIELLKLEFGSRAVGVLISLYQKIYSSGYYTFWDDDIQMLFARSVCEEKELIAKILERAMERGIFERILYENYNIITSVGIQQEYLRICRQSKRKQITLVKEYCLVTDPDLLAAVTEMQTLAGQPAEAQDAPPKHTPVQQPKTTPLKQDGKDTEVHGPALQATLHLRNKTRKRVLLCLCFLVIIPAKQSLSSLE